MENTDEYNIDRGRRKTAFCGEEAKKQKTETWLKRQRSIEILEVKASKEPSPGGEGKQKIEILEVKASKKDLDLAVKASKRPRPGGEGK